MYNFTENDVLTMLKPYNIFHNKKRLGPNEDGGYVCSEYVLENCSALFTYGVGNETRYEQDFHKQYQKPTYLFDHTVGWQKEMQWNDLTLIPEGLGTGENCKDLFEHCSRFNITTPILLKVDIEGGEWDYFRNVDMNKLDELVMGIMVEIHWLDTIQHQKYLAEIFNRLSPFFVLNHTHGNSWGYNFDYHGTSLPAVLELSFVNKRYVQNMEIDHLSYPITGLDFSNNPNIPDVELKF